MFVLREIILYFLTFGTYKYGPDSEYIFFHQEHFILKIKMILFFFKNNYTPPLTSHQEHFILKSQMILFLLAI